MEPTTESCYCIYEFLACEKELACLSCKVSKKYWKELREPAIKHVDEDYKPFITNQ